MRTILISGNDTGVGKTHVTGLLARELRQSGHSVQIVKAVETGSSPACEGDADRAAIAAGGGAEAITLFRFARPLAPLEAASRDGKQLSMNGVVSALRALAPCDWRLVEGAGGLAVPLDEDGSDWADLARRSGADFVVLVVEDRLGAINQARLLSSHCRVKEVNRPVFFLNSPVPPDEDVAASNRSGIKCLGFPLVEDGSAASLLGLMAKEAEG
ncbi:MAG: dethiobiotin synthase [Opitutaceae bacterium]